MVKVATSEKKIEKGLRFEALDIGLTGVGDQIQFLTRKLTTDPAEYPEAGITRL